jgi:hypothetical protein
VGNNTRRAVQGRIGWPFIIFLVVSLQNILISRVPASLDVVTNGYLAEYSRFTYSADIHISSVAVKSTTNFTVNLRHVLRIIFAFHQLPCNAGSGYPTEYS